jgi:uncharacterized protein (DUF1778 family)
MSQENVSEMNEQQLARYFEERKGDLSLWERKPAMIRVRRGGPSTVFSLRLTPEELEEIYRAAAKKGQTTSQFIRNASLDAAKRPVTPKDLAANNSRELILALRAAVKGIHAAKASLDKTEKELRKVR